MERTALFRLDAGRINAIRRLACVLLVAYHTARGGLNHIPNDIDWVNGICDSLVPLRMPLLSFLSGLVWAWRPVQPGKFWAFETNKGAAPPCPHGGHNGAAGERIEKLVWAAAISTNAPAKFVVRLR